MRNATANLRLLHDAGVPIVHGSDGPYGFSVLGRPREELQLLHAAGLDTSECLRAATSEAARLLGAMDRGAIAVGLRADLVVVDGDLERDLSALDRVVTVYRGGVPVETGGLSALRRASAVTRGLAATLASALLG
jgi:imidazolonepropionase-like amidohydrolase